MTNTDVPLKGKRGSYDVFMVIIASLKHDSLNGLNDHTFYLRLCDGPVVLMAHTDV